MKAELKILVSHIDLDGYGANVMFELSNFEHRKTYNFDNGNPINTGMVEVLSYIEEHKETNIIEVFFVDICPDHHLLETLSESSDDISIKVFDHHMCNKDKTIGIKNLTSDFRTTDLDKPDIKACGTSIFYDYLTANDFIIKEHQSYAANFVNYVSLYDTYQWKDSTMFGEFAYELNVFFSMFADKTEFVNYILNQRSKPCLVSSEGIVISHFINRDMKLLVKQKMLSDQKIIDDTITNDPDQISIDHLILTEERKLLHVAYYILDDRLSSPSEIAHQFLTKHNDVDVFISICLKRKSFEFRTIKDNIDTASLLAIPNGGGGHPKASGCPMSDDSIRNFRNIRPLVYTQFHYL